MHSPARFHVSRPLSLLAIVVIVCAIAVGGLFLRVPLTRAASPAHSTATTYHDVVKGTIAPAGVAIIPKAAQAQARASLTPSTKIDKGARPIHVGTRASANRAINAAATPLGHAGKLLRNFNGVSSLDSAVTNFGLEFEPPDQGLCVGNGFVLEAVNSAFTIYHRDGSVVTGPFNVNVLFNEGLAEFTSDPRCFFEQSTHTWVAIILFINDTGTEARTDIAVNRSGDPTTPWTVYHLEATDDGTGGMPSDPGCPCLGDQPLLGLDQENVYISTNEFSIFGPEFNGAHIYALSKSQLFGLSNSVHFVHFFNLNIGGAIAASVQPAITNGLSNAEFFMNSLDPFGTFDSRLGAWALTDRHNVSKGGIPTLSSVVFTSEAYGVPPNAVQKGAASLITSDDDRMQQVQFIDGNLWGALDTAITIPNDTAPRAGIAWFKVRPHLSGDVIGGADIRKQGYIASLGNYLLYPAIQVTHDGTAAIVMTLTGANFFPSAAFAILREGHSSFGPVKIAAAGTGPYALTSTRWGDYSWATLDPTHDSIWMATEYIPPLSSQTPDGLQNWGTRVLEVDANS